MREAPCWWRHRSLRARVLWPLSLLYRLFFVLHRAWGRWRRARLPVAVVVVGNLTAGGSGKTPVVAALARALAATGVRVGIVSRGYGRQRGGVRLVTGNDPLADGDEPTLLMQTTGLPVAVGADRSAAAALLLSRSPAPQVIVADDGLQHHRLPRVAEVVIVDPQQLGNGWLLPAGPLREPLARLGEASAVLVRGAANDSAARNWVGQWVGGEKIPPTWALAIEPVGLVPLAAWRQSGGSKGNWLPLGLLGARPVAAVAGIAAPERFFATLAALGAQVIPYPFPDHHPFRQEDLPPVPLGGWRLFTAKDAVKCAQWAGPHDFVLIVEARLPESLIALVRSLGGSATP